MPQVVWYFHLHQPWRLRPYRVFDIGQTDYFDIPLEIDFANQRVLEKVAQKSYRPMLGLLLELLNQVPDFKFSISITGVVLEQLQLYAPDVIELLQQIMATGRVEILAETYHHSLASLYDQEEFEFQVKQHEKLIQNLFSYKPTSFRNTELVYTNDIAQMVQELGYQGMLTEGADRILHGRLPTRVYASPSGLPLLLKHYRLSDDIAFRFSQRSWNSWPLTAEKYEYWLTGPFAHDDLINLFMDFETFGEHQWEAEGIFPFFKQLIYLLAEHPQASFKTVSQALAEHEPSDEFSASSPVSWADVDRDLTAWVGNPLQVDTLRILYDFKDQVLSSQDEQLIEDWRRLQTSDHFYYMCTKWSNDGDVHAYFSPYGSPYDAYVNFNNVLADFRGRLS